MTVLRNEGRWDASNADYRDGRVLRYEKGAPGMDWIDYGLSVLTPGALGSEADLADVFRRLAGQGRLAGYVATERFYEIGTPEGLAETEAFLSGRASSAGSESWPP
jgi:NDP-sugar pyrophosphorylase family protein